MKPDIYTKAVLTVIALMLIIIACKTIITPDTIARAQGPFEGVQCSGSGAPFFLDSRTGELWEYDLYHNLPGDQRFGTVSRKFRLTKLGEPLTLEIGKRSSSK
jgi:hypothetical protein